MSEKDQTIVTSANDIRSLQFQSVKSMIESFSEKELQELLLLIKRKLNPGIPIFEGEETIVEVMQKITYDHHFDSGPEVYYYAFDHIIDTPEMFNLIPHCIVTKMVYDLDHKIIPLAGFAPPLGVQNVILTPIPITALLSMCTIVSMTLTNYCHLGDSDVNGVGDPIISVGIANRMFAEVFRTPAVSYYHEKVAILERSYRTILQMVTPDKTPREAIREYDSTYVFPNQWRQSIDRWFVLKIN